LIYEIQRTAQESNGRDKLDIIGNLNSMEIEQKNSANKQKKVKIVEFKLPEEINIKNPKSNENN